MKKHKHIKYIVISAVTISAIITIFCIYCFSFSIIQGDYNNIDYIQVCVQDDNGNYHTDRITDSNELLYVYNAVAAGAKGETELVQLFPSHAYSKDSLIEINIVYSTGKQNIYVGYDNKLIYDLNPRFGSSERGFVYVDEPSVVNLLKDYFIDPLE